MANDKSGPLAGIKVVHLASLGPGPYATMLLADMGCDVVIVDRASAMQVSVQPAADPRRRGQRSIVLDLKNAEARAILLDLVRQADALIEGMRPGVAERLGVGPETCLGLNPKLVYARVTGWGQTGPLADRAGHDINYIALSGALLAMGPPDAPPPVPLNLLGDYAGGGAFVALGIVAALLDRERTGKGRTLDAAIIDGVASLTAATLGMLAEGRWGPRGTNTFDGSAPWYRTYATRDGGFVAVGAIEPPFYDALVKGLGLDPQLCTRDDRSRWPKIAEAFDSAFRRHDRAHWQAVFAGTDACVFPVLSFEEAFAHPHHVARGTYMGLPGAAQPAQAPRFDGRETSIGPEPAPAPGAHTDEVLRNLGRTEAEIARMRAEGAVA